MSTLTTILSEDSLFFTLVTLFAITCRQGSLTELSAMDDRQVNGMGGLLIATIYICQPLSTLDHHDTDDLMILILKTSFPIS